KGPGDTQERLHEGGPARPGYELALVARRLDEQPDRGMAALGAGGELSLEDGDDAFVRRGGALAHHATPLGRKLGRGELDQVGVFVGHQRQPTRGVTLKEEEIGAADLELDEAVTVAGGPGDRQGL